MRKLCVLVVLIVPALAFAQAGGKPAPPAPPPEIKKTVDAFVGTWTFDGVVTATGAEPVKVKEVYTCKKASGGMAVACTGKATIPGAGTMEDFALIAWVPEEKALHFVGASQTGEFHDHKCAWKDDKTMACEPLAVTAEGQPATVDLNATWSDAKNAIFTETTTAKDGSKKVSFEGKGKRK